jgi:chemotaxis protein histidine kinase CheA
MLAFKEFNNSICETADAGLAAKAEKSGVSIGTLRKVYKRGVAAWNSGHRPGTTPQQWGMARVNSYITKGKGTYHGADKDLREEVDAVESLESSLRDPSSYDAIDKMMQTIAKESGISPKQLHDSFVKKHGKTPDDYAKGVQEAAVPKDKESGLPKKYVAGLSKSTAKARAAHFAAADKLSDRDPEAYKPAPGDATAKTKESEHTKKYRAMFGEDMDEEIYEACWDTHKQVGMKKKGDRMVPDCVPKNEGYEDHHLFPDYMQKILKKHEQSPEEKAKNAAKAAAARAKAKPATPQKQEPYKPLGGRDEKSGRSYSEEFEAQFDLIEEYVEELALIHNMEAETIWETLESISDDELLEAAVDVKGHKSSTGGLTQKGRDYYNRQSGGNLKAPVTTPPSKLKAGSKAANRRKSFCARMSGVDGPMKKPNGEPSRKALALRKWNC